MRMKKIHGAMMGAWRVAMLLCTICWVHAEAAFMHHAGYVIEHMVEPMDVGGTRDVSTVVIDPWSVSDELLCGVDRTGMDSCAMDQLSVLGQKEVESKAETVDVSMGAEEDCVLTRPDTIFSHVGFVYGQKVAAALAPRVNVQNPLEGMDQLNSNEKVMTFVLPPALLSQDDVPRMPLGHYVFEYLLTPEFIHRRTVITHNGLSLEESLPKIMVKRGKRKFYKVKKIFWCTNGHQSFFTIDYAHPKIIISRAEEGIKAAVTLDDRDQLMLFRRGHPGKVLCCNVSRLDFGDEGEGFMIVAGKEEKVQKMLHFLIRPGCISIELDGVVYPLIMEGENSAFDDMKSFHAPADMQAVMPVIDGFKLLPTRDLRDDVLKIFYQGKTDGYSNSMVILSLGRCSYSVDIWKGQRSITLKPAVKEASLSCGGLSVGDANNITVLPRYACNLMCTMDRVPNVPFAVSISGCNAWEYRFMGHCTHFRKKRWMISMRTTLESVAHTFLVAPSVAVNVRHSLESDTLLAAIYYKKAQPLNYWVIPVNDLLVPGALGCRVTGKVCGMYRSDVTGVEGVMRVEDLSEGANIAYWEVSHVHDKSLWMQLRMTLQDDVLCVTYRHRRASQQGWSMIWLGGKVMWAQRDNDVVLFFENLESQLLTICSFQGLQHMRMAILRNNLGFTQKARIVFKSGGSSLAAAFEVRPALHHGAVALQWVNEASNEKIFSTLR